MNEAPEWQNRKASDIKLSNRGVGSVKDTALYMAPIGFACALPLIRISLRCAHGGDWRVRRTHRLFAAVHHSATPPASREGATQCSATASSTAPLASPSSTACT